MALFLNILLPNPGFVGNEWKANFLPQYPWKKVFKVITVGRESIVRRSQIWALDYQSGTSAS